MSKLGGALDALVDEYFELGHLGLNVVHGINSVLLVEIDVDTHLLGRHPCVARDVLTVEFDALAK
jgi:hypothetical protein